MLATGSCHRLELDLWPVHGDRGQSDEAGGKEIALADGTTGGVQSIAPPEIWKQQIDTVEGGVRGGG